MVLAAMALYKLTDDDAEKIEETTFRDEQIFERQNLQKILRDRIEVLAPDVMVLAEEFGNWQESRRRIDLLCLERSGRLVVVELKRTEDGGHMELQALRYAAMVSKMTFVAAVEAHQAYLTQRGRDDDAEAAILDFLVLDEPDEEQFANEIAIILASAQFSKELMTTVMWLGDHDIDIRCIKLRPHRLDDNLILDVQQIHPLPEAADYQIRIRAKEREERKTSQRDTTRFDLKIGDQRLINLTKLELAYQVIREAVKRGAAPREVMTRPRAWISVPGRHDEDFVSAVADQINVNPRRYHTDTDRLFLVGDETFALSKAIWGPRTRQHMDRIIEQFSLTDVSYGEASGTE
ncbi:MAG: hypothetical protein IH905_16865 [Proteobacteria bacterium]|nr:hypothetical protein [Pseudomonadota bacterium]